MMCDPSTNVGSIVIESWKNSTGPEGRLPERHYQCLDNIMSFLRVQHCFCFVHVYSNPDETAQCTVMNSPKCYASIFLPLSRPWSSWASIHVCPQSDQNARPSASIYVCLPLINIVVISIHRRLFFRSTWPSLISINVCLSLITRLSSCDEHGRHQRPSTSVFLWSTRPSSASIDVCFPLINLVIISVHRRPYSRDYHCHRQSPSTCTFTWPVFINVCLPLVNVALASVHRRLSSSDPRGRHQRPSSYVFLWLTWSSPASNDVCLPLIKMVVISVHRRLTSSEQHGRHQRPSTAEGKWHVSRWCFVEHCGTSRVTGTSSRMSLRSIVENSRGACCAGALWNIAGDWHVWRGSFAECCGKLAWDVSVIWASTAMVLFIVIEKKSMWV